MSASIALSDFDTEFQISKQKEHHPPKQEW